jgi:hypothetical protein
VADLELAPQVMTYLQRETASQDVAAIAVGESVIKC